MESPDVIRMISGLSNYLKHDFKLVSEALVIFGRKRLLASCERTNESNGKYLSVILLKVNVPIN